jgi:hypothetical protein
MLLAALLTDAQISSRSCSYDVLDLRLAAHLALFFVQMHSMHHNRFPQALGGPHDHNQ